MTEHQQSLRLDQMLVEQELVVSRSRARDLILRGFVLVDGCVELRPSRKVGRTTPLTVKDEAPRFVSRGAEKLISALDHFAYDPAGVVALDIGASTGGFTEVLLLRGALQVIAVDVGRDQLHSRLRQDQRVLVREQTDARQLTPDDLGGTVGCVVVDLSFVSVLKVIPSVLGLIDRNGFAVVLVKPQFEVGEMHIGKGGIVRNDAARAAAVAGVRAWFDRQLDWHVDDVIQSPILGGSGNIEYLLGARKIA